MKKNLIFSLILLGISSIPAANGMEKPFKQLLDTPYHSGPILNICDHLELDELCQMVQLGSKQFQKIVKTYLKQPGWRPLTIRLSAKFFDNKASSSDTFYNDKFFLILKLSKLTELLKNKKIVFDCQDTKITDEQLLTITKMFKDNLVGLNLWKCSSLTATGIKHLKKLPRLTELSYCKYGSNCRDDGIAEIVAQIPNLQKLTIAGGQQKGIVKLVQHVTNCPNLQELNLRTTALCLDNDPKKALTPEHFKSVTQCKKLHTLRFCGSGWNIGEKGLSHLCNLKNLKNLSINFAFPYKFFDKDAYEITMTLQRLKTIFGKRKVEFDCKDENVTDSILVTMVAFFKDNLVGLNLWNCNKLTDKGLGVLKNLPYLKKLNLDYCYKLTDGALENVAKIKSLQTLHFGGNKMLGSGIKHLINLPKLRSLNFKSKGSFHNNKITDTDLGFIAQCKALRKLNLRGVTSITNNGIIKLANLPNIRHILFDTWSNHLSQDGFEKLQSKLPLTKIARVDRHHGDVWGY